MTILTQVAEAAPATSDIFVALGIDWRLLILQIVAFLILVFLLGKFVYPRLMKSVDERQARIEAAAQAAQQAEETARQTQQQVAELLQKARQDAADIVGIARQESTALLSSSEQKAKLTAQKIIDDAHEQLEKATDNARRMLYNETLDLVARATEKVAAVKVDAKADAQLVRQALKESE